MEIKVGDKVRVSKDAPKMYFFGCNYDNSVCKVILVDRDNAVITQVKNGSFAIPTKYLTKVNAEADANEKLQEEFARFMSGHTPISFADRIEREHIQRRMRVLSQDDFLKDFDPAEHEVNPKPLNAEFWVKYEADLAKEIAVKLSKPNDNKPDYVAEYAVSVAKAVVENLRKQ